MLNYKWSQDHAELLFGGVRSRGGNNNNPAVQQLKAALKALALHASVTSSKYSNCISFDSELVSPIFSLKWSKNRSAVSRKEEDVEDPPIDIEMLDRFTVSKNKKIY